VNLGYEEGPSEDESSADELDEDFGFDETDSTDLTKASLKGSAYF
jgi:hypothetical protein